MLKGASPVYRIYDSNTLTFKSNVNISNFVSGSSLSYDSVNNRLYLAQYAQRLCYVFDNEFNQLLTFDVAPYTGYESQSFEYFDGNLYFTVINIATSDNSWSYAPAYIYVFNQNGEVVKIITPTGAGSRRELEGIAVDEITGKVYFLYNNWDYNKNGNTGTTPIEIWTMDSDVKFRLNVNGGTLSSSHGSSIGQSGNYITSNGSTTVMTIAHGTQTPDYGLPDYNNAEQTNIVKTGYHAVSGAEWKLSSGKTFHQNKIYYAGDFCNALMSNCVVDLYVNWTPNKYTIKFDGNGGIGSMSDINATYDKSNALARNGFTNLGYRFTGWNTKADGSGTAYNAEAKVSNLTATNGGIVTLYAQWEEAPSSIIDITDDLILGANDMIIGNVIANTNIEELISKLTFSGEAQVLDKSGNEVIDRTTIVGGDIIRITNGSDVSNYKILLRGDVNQDDIVNISDASYLARYIIERDDSFSPDGRLFADINRDDDIKMNDVMLLINEYL